jgi:peptide/nickel transport system ATP-binding protein
MIRIKHLSAYYQTVQGTVKATEDVTFDIFDNEILGIAGESGCGKTTLMKAIYGNVEPPMFIASGSIELEVEELGEQKIIPNQEIHRYWWDYISYIPQASMSVLNPVVRIKDQFLDSYLRAEVRALGKQVLLDRMAVYLQELELPSEVLNAFPHQLSGGMRQRVIVALATFVHPKFVLADEPTTALDVVVQRGILTMLMNLQKQLHNTFVIVSHDMGVHYQITDRMVIMYAGKVAEIARTDVLFERPQHPYTEMLINSLPRMGDDQQRAGIGGRPPSLLNPPDGCRFADRCYLADAHCRQVQPDLIEVEPGHFVACLKRAPTLSLTAPESSHRGDAGK